MSDRVDNPTGDADEDIAARIGAYVDGRLSAPQERQFEQQVLGSDRLAEALYADLTLRGALGPSATVEAGSSARPAGFTPRSARASRRARRPLWLQPRVLIPVAAALALLVVLPRMLSNPAERPPVLRGADRPPVGLRAVGDLPAPPASFEWTSHPLADRYRFRLYDGQDTLLFETIVREPTVSLASGSVDWSGISEGYWVVTPLAGGGGELAPSRPQRFRLVSR